MTPTIRTGADVIAALSGLTQAAGNTASLLNDLSVAATTATAAAEMAA